MAPPGVCRQSVSPADPADNPQQTAHRDFQIHFLDRQVAQVCRRERLAGRVYMRSKVHRTDVSDGIRRGVQPELESWIAPGQRKHAPTIRNASPELSFGARDVRAAAPVTPWVVKGSGYSMNLSSLASATDASASASVARGTIENALFITWKLNGDTFSISMRLAQRIH